MTRRSKAEHYARAAAGLTVSTAVLVGLALVLAASKALDMAARAEA